MTIDEFKSLMQGEVDNFFQNYRDEHEADADMWPLEMTEEEWHEQILTIFN